jgi:protein gp37
MTTIEWTDKTWNPITGCTKISPGCRNCYAERMAKRLAGRHGYPADEPFRVTFHPERLEEPLRWKKPQDVFVCSMGDLFHEDVPTGWVYHVFDVMAEARQHTFQILTKRPENIRGKLYEGRPRYMAATDYLPNVWLGVSAEDQKRADERSRWLLKVPAAVRLLSLEPLLGPVEIGLATPCDRDCAEYQDAECPATSGLCIMQGQFDWIIGLDHRRLRV